MASSTRSQIIAEFTGQGFYPDCDSTTAGVLFDNAWSWLTVQLRLRDTTITVNLTEGVREYAFDGFFAATREAYYQQQASPDTWIVLQGVSIDVLARVEPSWRANTNEDQPSRYYIKSINNVNSGSRVVGFDILPGTTTSGGYPNVTFYGVQRSTLGGSEAVPDFLITDEVFLYQMAWRWATRQDPSRAAYWKTAYDTELAMVSDTLKSSSDDVAPQVFINPFVNKTSRAF